MKGSVLDPRSRALNGALEVRSGAALAGHAQLGERLVRNEGQGVDPLGSTRDFPLKVSCTQNAFCARPECC